jgi:hypothetical protein
MSSVARKILSVVDPVDGLLAVGEVGANLLPWLTDADGVWTGDLASTPKDASFSSLVGADWMTGPYTLVDHVAFPNRIYLYDLEAGASTFVDLDFASVLGGVTYTAWKHMIYCHRPSGIIYHYGVAYDAPNAYVFTRTISVDGATVVILDEQSIGSPFNFGTGTWALPLTGDTAAITRYHPSPTTVAWSYDFMGSQTLTVLPASGPGITWNLIGGVGGFRFHHFTTSVGDFGYADSEALWTTTVGDLQVAAVATRQNVNSYTGFYSGQSINSSGDGSQLVSVAPFTWGSRDVAATSDVEGGLVPITTGVLFDIPEPPAASAWNGMIGNFDPVTAFAT